MNDTLAGSHGDARHAPRERARLIDLPLVSGDKGVLVWAQVGAHLPFEVRRFFCIFGVPAGEARGQHAHRELHEMLVCVRGHCTVLIDDGSSSRRFMLDTPARGLYVPPLTWATQCEFSADALLAVLASETYRPEDYVHDYAEFVALARAQP
jgi:UDP-2-acetamido-3-amino-2,3-dideoxy-glucuronate N-acetyltransferase